MPAPAPELAPIRSTIDRCFGVERLETVLAALAEGPDAWAREQRRIIAERSPLATRVTFAQLRRGVALGFEACMRLEYRMVHRMLASGEFAEGVRALLIDRDKRPRWRHGRIEDVPEAEVEATFAPLPAGDLPLDWQGI
jgi:enoyl-CoA hydratase